MSLFDHIYAAPNVNLSEYAHNLNTEAKNDYLEKLKIVMPDDRVVYVPDPYVLDEDSWMEDMTEWPRITKTEIENYLSKFPGRNTRSREAFNYVMSGKSCLILFIISLLNNNGTIFTKFFFITLNL